MTDQHPITPPPELVEEWREEAAHRQYTSVEVDLHIAEQAARWGADQELEACCEWLAQLRPQGDVLVTRLCAVRRPEPPSLKEQALAELELLRGDANAHGLGFDAPTIRRALEALDD